MIYHLTKPHNDVVEYVEHRRPWLVISQVPTLGIIPFYHSNIQPNFTTLIGQLRTIKKFWWRA